MMQKIECIEVTHLEAIKEFIEAWLQDNKCYRVVTLSGFSDSYRGYSAVIVFEEDYELNIIEDPDAISRSLQSMKDIMDKNLGEKIDT